MVSHNRNSLNSSRELTRKQQLQNTCFIPTEILLNLHWRTDSDQELKLLLLSSFIWFFFLLPFMPHLSYLLTSWVIIITGVCLSQQAPQSSRFACCCIHFLKSVGVAEDGPQTESFCFLLRPHQTAGDKHQIRRRVKYPNVNSLDFNAKQLRLL